MVPLSMIVSDLWPGFQDHNIFWSRISEKRHSLKTKLLLHKRKLYLTYGMVLFGDLDWPLNASHGFVSISWGSCSNGNYYSNFNQNRRQPILQFFRMQSFVLHSVFRCMAFTVYCPWISSNCDPTLETLEGPICLQDQCGIVKGGSSLQLNYKTETEKNRDHGFTGEFS